MSEIIYWDKLKISQSELDSILDLDLFSSWAIDLNRLLIQQKREYLNSFLISELSVLFLGLILFFPLNLLIFRKLGFLANNPTGFMIILFASLLVAMGGLWILNYYLWRRAKKLKSLTVILDKIEQYNRLIDNFKLVNEINSINYKDSSESQSSYRQLPKIETALNLTKASLLKSINLEKIINLNQNKIRDRQELFDNLENDLIQLLSSPSDRYLREYQQLLTEVVQIGLSVHQEIRKTQI